MAWSFALALGGCALLLHRSPGQTPSVPAGVVVRVGAIDSSTGCQLDYRLFRPVAPGADGGVLVVLGHGFLRSQQRMTDLAIALARAGVPVATLDLCNMRPWDGRHVQNGQDMIALARVLGGQRVIYAGFSAGALAALVAGRSDPHAIGIVALDLVETQGIGVRAATGLDTPLLGIAGEPTNCNAGGNGALVFAAHPRARVQRIAGAGHCDFESPSDRLCERLCEDPDQGAQTRRAEVIAATLAAVRSLLEPGLAGVAAPAGRRGPGPG